MSEKRCPRGAGEVGRKGSVHVSGFSSTNCCIQNNTHTYTRGASAQSNDNSKGCHRWLPQQDKTMLLRWFWRCFRSNEIKCIGIGMGRIVQERASSPSQTTKADETCQLHSNNKKTSSAPRALNVQTLVLAHDGVACAHLTFRPRA